MLCSYSKPGRRFQFIVIIIGHFFNIFRDFHMTATLVSCCQNLLFEVPGIAQIFVVSCPWSVARKMSAVCRPANDTEQPTTETCTASLTSDDSIVNIKTSWLAQPLT